MPRPETYASRPALMCWVTVMHGASARISLTSASIAASASRACLIAYLSMPSASSSPGWTTTAASGAGSGSPSLCLPNTRCRTRRPAPTVASAASSRAFASTAPPYAPTAAVTYGVASVTSVAISFAAIAPPSAERPQIRREVPRRPLRGGVCLATHAATPGKRILVKPAGLRVLAHVAQGQAEDVGGPQGVPVVGSQSLPPPVVQPSGQVVGGPGLAALPATSRRPMLLSLIHISEPTRLGMRSYAVFCLKKK